jgi:hypothetical protein
METTGTNNQITITENNSSRFTTFYYIIFFISFLVFLILLFFIIAYLYPDSIFNKILIKLSGGPTQSEKIAAIKSKISAKKNGSTTSGSTSGTTSGTTSGSTSGSTATSGSSSSIPGSQSSLNDAVEKYKYQQNYINTHMMEPPTQTEEAVTHKNGWCLIGNDKGYNSCVKVGYNDYCMSGDIYPTKDICLNPSLRL